MFMFLQKRDILGLHVFNNNSHIYTLSALLWAALAQKCSNILTYFCNVTQGPSIFWVLTLLESQWGPDPYRVPIGTIGTLLGSNKRAPFGPYRCPKAVWIQKGILKDMDVTSFQFIL